MSSRNTPLHRQNRRQSREGGNATIYVLIVVALFAALAFTVARQNDASESNRLNDEQANLIVGQIIAYPYQVKQAIEMMIMSGADLDTLDYTLPGMAGYDTKPLTRKIFHPAGGGLSLGRLPEEAVDSSATGLAPGWYLGTFNNVKWTPSDKTDMILTAYPLTRQICEKLNERLTSKIAVDGSGQIILPALSNTIPNVLIDGDNPPGHAVHGGLNVAEFDETLCPECEEMTMLCVEDSNDHYGFYTVLIGR